MRLIFLVFSCATLLVGCGDPLADFEKLSDVELVEDPSARGILAEPEEISSNKSFFARILRRGPDPKAGVDEGQEATVGVNAVDAPVVEASLDPAMLEKASSEEIITTTPKRGLLGGLLRPSPKTEALSEDVQAGAPLAFGTVGRNCEIRGKDLGERIGEAGKGRGYVLYDSQPAATTPRAFYVTGFADGCARQFTAALAMFGAPSMHEQLRYGKPADTYPYSETDKAYEKVKSKICSVGRKKPCGAKISKLERNTVFISTYERFSNSGRWADILLHDGAVMASAVKSAP